VTAASEQAAAAEALAANDRVTASVPPPPVPVPDPQAADTHSLPHEIR
jgi:hypothetical protein